MILRCVYVTTPIVSMVDGELFDKLERIGAMIKHKESEPFGGIQVMSLPVLADLSVNEISQVVITGDFFQLPPVSKNKPICFAFEADAWKKTIKKAIRLTKVFRQKDKGEHLRFTAWLVSEGIQISSICSMKCDMGRCLKDLLQDSGN